MSPNPLSREPTSCEKPPFTMGVWDAGWGEFWGNLVSNDSDVLGRLFLAPIVSFRFCLSSFSREKCPEQKSSWNPWLNLYNARMLDTCLQRGRASRKKSTFGITWSNLGNSQGGGGKTYRAILGGGGKTYHKAPPPKPVLEASESGICLVCAHFL